MSKQHRRDSMQEYVKIQFGEHSSPKWTGFGAHFCTIAYTFND